MAEARSVQFNMRQALSWLVVGLGIFVGLYRLVMAGQSSVDGAGLDWLYVCGFFLLGFVFLVASFTALRDRRRAGIIFLVGAPAVSFALASPEALVWSTSANGSTYGTAPGFWMALILSALFYAPFIALVFARRNRRRAIGLFVVFAVLAGVVFSFSEWTRPLLPSLAAWSAMFVMFGGFWFGTFKLGWAPLIAARPRSLGRRLVTILGECLLVAGLYLGGTFALMAKQSSLWTGDCSGASLFVRPLRPGHVVFTARLIFVGHTVKVSGRWAGDWAIGVVQERFWGLPRWPGVVFLTNAVFWEGETYFVSGSRDVGSMTRYLPIVNAGRCGSYYSEPAKDAEIELRLLRKPPLAGEFRIAGCVRREKPLNQEWKPPAKGATVYEWSLSYFQRYSVLVGARVGVTGSSGTLIFRTDRDGIYDTGSLPPDDYTFRLLDVPADQVAYDRKLTRQDLMQMRLFQLDLRTFWDGSIEGHVRDAAGGPAWVSMELRNPDGTEVGPEVPRVYRNSEGGSFLFTHLPIGGRYLLLLNTGGPSLSSPYPLLYYPSAVRSEDARVLEIKAGDAHIKNIDFMVRQLVERTLQVRARWADGRPLDRGEIHIAYEHTGSWKDLITAPRCCSTDGIGAAEIHVFGDSRVRIFAVGFVGEELSPRYSAVVEMETAKLGSGLDLVVSYPEVRLGRR
jgi:hypothetical protein